MKLPFVNRIKGWLAGRQQRQTLNARIAAAQITVENQKHLAMADSLSARAAYSPTVRKRVREFSRLEWENDSWYAGMIRTAANHIVGKGPRLQVLTPDKNFNARLERAWNRWAKQIKFAGKLRTIVETDWRDGEVFAMKAYRPRIYPIPLDIRLYETEQIAQPWVGVSVTDQTVEDGIRIDANSNDVEFYIYDHHPGDTTYAPSLKGEWYPAHEVIHYYLQERPGQVRGIPRCTPALPMLPIMRRHTLATLFAAETAANVAAILRTNSSALAPAAIQGDFTLFDVPRNGVLQIPEGWDISQFEAENPSTTHEMFQRQTLMQFARCANMPYGLAAGTSKDSNFSSHKGDVKNLWGPAVDTERDRLEADVVEVLWLWFLEDVAMYTDILSGAPMITDIDHQWFWPPLPSLDEIDDATAALTRVTSGLSSLSKEHNRNGEDYETYCAKMAADLGLDVPTVKKVLAQKLFSISGQATPAITEPEGQPSHEPAGEYTQLSQRAFNNNQKRIQRVLQNLIDGEVSRVMAEQTLQSIGLAPDRVRALIVDALDGQINDPQLQEAAL